MRRTSIMTLLFLVLSIAFFFLPDFREAMRGPVASGFAKLPLVGPQCTTGH